jgi:hypothetical protein
VQLKTEKIGFIKMPASHIMEDRNAQVPDKHNSYPKSLFTQREIVLDALKARISELEQIRDQVLYELEKLKNMSE